ncbi:MAG TPA: N,N-dimethylformamidase beta subunit family domain-containing protein [Solirubrobacteraceae bacterium]|nr:N,N-dimethylformamidase beta subunit family domain-containing protein [Solirubrobacteraceae bacterium]
MRKLLPLLACLAVAIPAGCGSSSQGSGAPTPAAATPTGPFQWLVSTSGPPPSVAQENRNPGTTAWRLPGPADDVGGLVQGNVAGYVSAPAVLPGQIERIFVNAPGSHYVRIRVFRMGWYGGTGGREMLVSHRLPLRDQPPCTHRSSTGLTECAWHPTLSFQIPTGLPSGVYIAKLSAPTGQADTLFVVRSISPQPLLAQLPTSTYQAYNAWGGDSLYPGGADPVGLTGTTQGVEVSYDRPYDSNTGAGQFFARDVAMVRFLERYGYPVSYTTSEAVDADPGQLQGHRALLDFGHSEYWSQRQADGFTAARDAGTNLAFLSSDALGWRVRYEPATSAASQPGAAAHLIVSYKEHASADPNPGQSTGLFPNGGAPLTGSAYVGCITPRLNTSGPPTYRYYLWAPNPQLQPSWLFAGTGVSSDTRIAGIQGYELDLRTPASPPGTSLVGYGHATCMRAPPGEPVPGPGQNLGEATVYRASSGALVFSTGTLGWELGLEPVPSASPDAPRAPDSRVVAMTRNLLSRMLSGPAGGR